MQLHTKHSKHVKTCQNTWTPINSQGCNRQVSIHTRNFKQSGQSPQKKKTTQKKAPQDDQWRPTIGNKRPGINRLPAIIWHRQTICQLNKYLPFPLSSVCDKCVSCVPFRDRGLSCCGRVGPFGFCNAKECVDESVMNEEYVKAFILLT